MLFIFVNLFVSGLAVAIHYEALAWISLRLPEIDVSHRLRILIGLVLIAWTASFMFFLMQKNW